MDNTPGLVTAALFIAVIISDLMKRRADSAKGHFFLGIVAFLLINYLHQEGHDFVAWGILSVPFILIIIGVFFGGTSQPPRPSPPPYPTPSPTPYPPSYPTPYPPPYPPSPGPDPGSGSSCPVPGQMIPAKKECAACVIEIKIPK